MTELDLSYKRSDNMATSINLNIGDVSIFIAGNSQIKDWEIAPSYSQFVSAKEPEGNGRTWLEVL